MSPFHRSGELRLATRSSITEPSSPDHAETLYSADGRAGPWVNPKSNGRKFVEPPYTILHWAEVSYGRRFYSARVKNGCREGAAAPSGRDSCTPETRPDCRQAHRRSVSATFYRRSVAADELAVGPLPDRLPESQAEKRMGATPWTLLRITYSGFYPAAP